MTNPHGTGFARRLGWGARPAVVVVDLVRAYTEPGGPFFLGGEDPATPGRVLDACAAVVAAARSIDVPVVWTVVRYAPDLADAGFFAVKVPALACFAEGADGGWGELSLAPAAADALLVKQHASSFAGTSLAATLRSRGVDTVVVAGVSTSGCVRATATDALAAGFRPVVVDEACGDRTAALHRQNLADLDAKYADVVDLDTAVGELRSRGG
ncbi:isochorismatase family protein [Actinomycetospora sp. TBRC 11914]|uniref:isochorismatase family protein n=1 Tax=Actinomycetospora sp. TBRC 11914 TaxID=2729387 RepID=UPI00145F36D6|nr:isochorismatase family protein [Actinomycetospora sp. TBRC 11914]NMO92881.1 isochorismatase family protein [Actinomycetospora sp. TBRC 11914]